MFISIHRSTADNVSIELIYYTDKYIYPLQDQYLMNQMMDQIVEAYLKNKDQGSFGTKDKIFFYREMAYLIEWWVSILESVNTIASTTDNYAIKQICQVIAGELSSGQSFSKALGKLTKYFSEGDVNIIKSGESSWEMITILKSLAREYEFL